MRRVALQQADTRLYQVWDGGAGGGVLIWGFSINLFQLGRFHCGVVLPICLILENGEEMGWAIKFIGLHGTLFEGDWIRTTLLSHFFLFKLPCKMKHYRTVCGDFYKNILWTYSVDACAVDLCVQIPVCCERKWESVCAACCTFFKFLALVRESYFIH